MSDLSGKFTGLETDLLSHKTEIVNALDAIAAALGGAPAETFADLITAVTAGNTLLNTIRLQQATKLDAIFNMLDTMNNNASLNAQRMLTLMLQTACPCDPNLALLPLPLDVTPTARTTDLKCQRIQFVLDLWRSWVLECGDYLATNGSISSAQIASLQETVVAAVGITNSELFVMSQSTRDSLAYALNGSGTPGNVNAGLFYTLTSTPLLADMRQALYAEDNAAAGRAAAANQISIYEPTPDGVLSRMFYSGWANTMYAALPEIDASAYDGTICAPVVVSQCITADAPAAGSHAKVVWPQNENNEWMPGDFYLWTWEVTNYTGTREIQLYALEDLSTLNAAYDIKNPGTIMVHTNMVASNCYLLESNGGTYTLTLCPPAGL